jgi:FMN phosphatase YigB (HAD superfamily)
MLKAVFFDLDGTLIYMNEDLFLKLYFDGMKEWLTENGRDAENFVNGVIAGTRAMFKNDGRLTNEEIFWQSFEGVLGKVTDEDKALMDGYYEKVYPKTLITCKGNPYSADIVKFCREASLITVLSTNPLFPKAATLKRMEFSGLREEDFHIVTAYENSGYCKPNPAYFISLMERFGLSADEVIVFGNNTYDDGECALMAGLKCYIIESENLIENEKSTHEFERIKITDVVDVIKKHMAM